MPRLTLRLWASSFCSRVVGRCVLLDHEEVCICIDARGVAAFVCESSASCAPPSGTEEPWWPRLRLERTEAGQARWFIGDKAVDDAEARDTLEDVGSRPALDEAGRRTIVASIHNYYRQHVLEPSVAGFLSILEKQFARADLYLFELLQNAEQSLRKLL